MTRELTERVRRRDVREPVAAGVYLAPEALAAYEARDGSPGTDEDGVARPEVRSYFTSGGSCIGSSAVGPRNSS